MKTIRISETAFHFFAILTGGNYFTNASKRVLQSEFVDSLVGNSIVVPEPELQVVPTDKEYARPLDAELVKYIIREHYEGVKNSRVYGTKLHMIKFCRIVTGWGLKEAKDYMEKEFPEIL